jgi:hypothetical protein
MSNPVPVNRDRPCDLCGYVCDSASYAYVWDLPGVGMDMCFACVREAAKSFSGFNLPLCDYCDTDWVVSVVDGWAALCDECYSTKSPVQVGAKMIEGRFPNPNFY